MMAGLEKRVKEESSKDSCLTLKTKNKKNTLTTTCLNLRYGEVPAIGVRGYGENCVDTAEAECWQSQVCTKEDSGSAG